MEWKYILASIVYSVIGISILSISFWIFEKVTPGTLWRELIEEHNTALAIVAALQFVDKCFCAWQIVAIASKKFK